MPRTESLDQYLAQSFDRVRRGRRDGLNRFKVDFRASSLPVCPRLYHIYRRLPWAKRPFVQESFTGDAAAMSGTALHLALQRWFGLECQAFGRWKCFKCDVNLGPVAGVQACPKCQAPMVYQELEVEKSKLVPFTGHIDMVLVQPKTDRVYLLDFKTISPRKIFEVRQSGPYRKHYYQINAYANAINLGQQDVGVDHVDKVVLIYVDRGDPWITWAPVQMPVSRKVYRETLALIATAKRSIKEMRPPRGICTSADDPDAHWCPVKHMCFSPLLETMLSDEVQPRDTGDRDRTYDRLLQEANQDVERQD
jgi:hypothetical protein